jgi:coenzyme F420-0:L-glutamate ligase/coenzyme F420-1:gamma-L-glutamate ligase
MNGDVITIFGVSGMREIAAGDDLADIIASAVLDQLEDGDILVVTSKIVSKAEGRQMAATDREAAISAETVRVVATRAYEGGVTRIVENRLGIVAAAAGVDASNVPEGTILLLPLEPDASARRLCTKLRKLSGKHVGVIISDTLGRPWREGQTDVAIGAAGVRVLDDLRGGVDSHGRPLEVTMPAVADELAAAGDLVKGKAKGVPVAVVRGMGRLVTGMDEPGAHSLVRDASRDMFRLGSDEAERLGYERGITELRR